MKMKPLQTLYVTQFLSAFADNMILFITLAIIKQNAFPDYYIGVVQACFLVAFVIFAPFVGAFADKNAKSQRPSRRKCHKSHWNYSSVPAS